MARGFAWHGTCIAGERATAADSMHPTGMHSCLLLFFFVGHKSRIYHKKGNISICLTSVTRAKLNDKMAFPA